MSGISGIEVSDFFGLSQPLTKLVDVVSNGIGILYEPTNIKRLAKAKAKEIDIVSTSVRDNIDLPQVYEDGKIRITTLDSQDISQRAALRQNYQETKKQQNIESVIMNASEQLKDEEEVSEEPVDSDWATRFFNIVGEISSDEIQLIWGKILAGEIKSPGSFSFRTLDVLRNLSQKEALIFAKVANYVFESGSTYYIINNDAVNVKHKLFFMEILTLDECGLITAQPTGFRLEAKKQLVMDANNYMSNNDYICILKSISGNITAVPINIFNLTESGKELYQIVRGNNTEQYTFDCFKSLKNSQIELSVHKIKAIYIERNGLEYYEPSIDIG